MKKSLVMVSLVAVSTSMMAMDLQYFLGAGVNRVDNDSKTTINMPSVGYSDTSSDSFKDTGLALKTGIILDKKHRISIAYSDYSKNDTDATSITGNYDYLIPMNNEIRLYTGLHLGDTTMKINDVDLGSVKASGLVYGAQVGAIYDITKNIEFELGLAYSKYNVDKSISGTISGIDYNGKIELEDSTSMFAGINYKF